MRLNRGIRPMASEGSKSTARARVLFETLDTAQSARLESRFSIDLRQHPRVETDISATVTGPGGHSELLTISNASRSGLRLEGTWKAIRALIVDLNSRTPYSDTPNLLNVSFFLPSDRDRGDRVTAICRVVYSRDSGDGIIQIGAEIASFAAGRVAYFEYLQHRLEHDRS